MQPPKRSTTTEERIAFLKALHAEWMRELPQLLHTDPERAVHHAEALDDLASLIGQLELDRRCRA